MEGLIDGSVVVIKGVKLVVDLYEGLIVLEVAVGTKLLESVAEGCLVGAVVGRD